MQGFLVLFQPSSLRFLFWGFTVTLQIALTTIALSFAAGVVLGALRYSKEIYPESRLARRISQLTFYWIEALRNLPMLLLMLFMRFVSGLPPIWAAIAGMSLYTSAVLAEVVRGGLLSVDKGQWEAGLSQGLTPLQVLRHIVLPQALRNMIPPFVSQFITVMKDTSYAWALGIQEITGSGVILFAKYLNPMQTFIFIAGVFFVTNFSMQLLARSYERRLAVGRA